MFTGIVEERGVIKEKKANSLVIAADKVLEELKQGDSIAVNGVCLTVTELSRHIFNVDVMPETLKLTNLDRCSIGEKVNLERAMRLGDRFGGHLVSGHIDGLGRIVEKSVKGGEIHPLTFASGEQILQISVPRQLTKYIVKKGSVAVEGISLTVAEVKGDVFTVCLIPHTLKITTLGQKNIGDLLNIEVDMIGKYVEKLLDK
jgi:riboflavin synthase